MKRATFGGLIIGVSMLAFAGMASATYNHGGTSGVFLNSSTTTGGYFTGHGSVDSGAGMAGGADAQSNSGNSEVAGGTFQTGSAQGSNGSVMTGTGIDASANQTPHGSNASASTGSVAEGSVQNGSVATFTSTGASATANNWGHHHWSHPEPM